MDELKSAERSPWWVPGMLFGGFIVVQGFATGTVIAGLAHPIVVFAQAVAVVLVLAAAAFTALILKNRKYLAAYSALAAQSEHPVWLASRVPATLKALGEVDGGFRGELSSLFAVSFSSKSLQVIALPSGEQTSEIEFASITGVHVGKIFYFGGASECLMVAVGRRSGAVDVPFVLHRDSAPGYLTQSERQLRDAMATLVGFVAGGRLPAPE